MTMKKAIQQFREGEAARPLWYLNNISPPTLGPFASDLKLRLLQHDSTVANGTDGTGDENQLSWFFSTTADFQRLAANCLVEGVEYTPVDGLRRFLQEEIVNVLSQLPARWNIDTRDVKDVRLFMPQLKAPQNMAEGESERPIVINGNVLVPSPDSPGCMLVYTPNEAEHVRQGTTLSFRIDELDDDGVVDGTTDVEIGYDTAGAPTLSYAERYGYEEVREEEVGPWKTQRLPEKDIRSLLDPSSWALTAIRHFCDPGKGPLVRGSIELLTDCPMGSDEDLLETFLGNTWKSGFAYRFATGRWKEDPSGASKRDDANRELNSQFQALTSFMNSLLKPLPDGRESPNLEVMVNHLFQVRAPWVQEKWTAVYEGMSEVERKACKQSIIWSPINELQRAAITTEVRKLFQGCGQTRTLARNGAKRSLSDSCFREVRGRLFEPGFIERLDANKWLLPFRDGVYELRTGIFRNLRPTDYVMRSVPYTFAAVKPYLAACLPADTEQMTPQRRERNWLLDVLKRIYPVVDEASRKHEVFEYVMGSLFAQMLCGDQSMTPEGHKFVNHTGNTRNGKTLVQHLLLYVFGDGDGDASVAPGFFASPSMSIATSDEKANAPAPDMIFLDRARCVCVDETTRQPVKCELLKKRTGGAPKVKAAKKYKDPQNVSMDAAGWHFWGQWELKLKEGDEALNERVRTIRYLAYFARDDKSRAEMEAKGHNKAYIFEADSTIDNNEVRRKWAPIFMALLIDRWERYHLGRGDDVATWPEATSPPGKWPPIPSQVEEWTKNSKGGGCENPYSEWVAENVVLCGSEGAACKGWSACGDWTCSHFLLWTATIKKEMAKTNAVADGIRKSGGERSDTAEDIKTFEAATGRHHISKLTATDQKRIKAASRHNLVFPAMQLRSALNAANEEPQP